MRWTIDRLFIVHSLLFIVIFPCFFIFIIFTLLVLIINFYSFSLTGRAYLKEWTLIMYGTTENPDRRTIKSSSSPSSETASPESTKPYYNDKLGNDLEKSYDDTNSNPSRTMNSDINGNSSTRKPYPQSGWFSGRYPIKQSGSLGNDKGLKKIKVQPMDNNDINLLSPINQNTQHNSGTDSLTSRQPSPIIISTLSQ